MRIEYAVKPLLNIPVKWVTRIQEVKEYNCFTDVQEKGPYSLWEHTHTFEECGDSVLMKDHIRYKLPLGILGNVFHFVVLKKLKNIFKFRKEFIENKFNNYGKLVA
ncbi:MAG TPA: SRPBCC family protein [Bacteroidia bacterium]|nr:SRPBCC family protein [Bacteroidia bacterium]